VVQKGIAAKKQARYTRRRKMINYTGGGVEIERALRVAAASQRRHRENSLQVLPSNG
jgi:hypothetical protein